MPYKDWNKQKEAQRKWNAARRARFMAGRLCADCGESATQATGIGVKSWFTRRVEIVEKLLRSAVFLCDECELTRKQARESKRIIHGHARTKNSKVTGTYRTWLAMKQRCNDQKHDAYRFYGALGVKVCPRWLLSFKSFLDDMGARPIGTTLDRKNPNGNYTKRNCRWADAKTQAVNKRKNAA